MMARHREWRPTRVESLSYDQDTIHAEKACVEMRDFCIAALMFLTGHCGIKGRTHVPVEITHFPIWCTIRTWKELSLQPHAPQALIIQLIGKWAISTWTWVLAIFPFTKPMENPAGCDWINSLNKHASCIANILCIFTKPTPLYSAYSPPSND